ncbi:MAG: biotin transporter BioY [Devosia sp.]|uniref:biotin transporter BioY n=1 Tax=Devosia sp. TaxID=1871048 RepID=UPI001A634F00|nr:biotin transporter BioY [Devosia sp.]MBL8596584.1 biotin transporter BioY [Devosia sp.]
MAVTLTTPNTILGVLEPKSQTTRLISNVFTVLLGTVLITLAAKINVPTWPVPVTLQSFAVAALAAAFGWRIGTATVIAYLLEGAAGLPVFATGGGMAYLAGPTGGFLLAFVPMAYVIGRAADLGASAKIGTLLLAMLIADALLFALGFLWLLVLGSGASWIDQSNIVGSAFARAVQPFLVWDALKMLFAALTVTGIFTLAKKRA